MVYNVQACLSLLAGEQIIALAPCSPTTVAPNGETFISTLCTARAHPAALRKNT